jgi:uncharacterized membrane protein YeaQ/YmgE (transglycosylase-associated protein family)
MSIIGWIVLGAIAGWLASMVAGRNAQMGLLANIIAGIIGALIGGFLFSMFGGAGVTGFNIYSLLVAFVGAVVVLLIWNAISGRRSL